MKPPSHKIGPAILNGEKDPVEAAAWVHQQIGNIHPFGDANGRIARLWMSAILQLGGYRAVVFPSDEAYTKAITQDQKGEALFVDYLREVIEWNHNQSEL